MSDEKTNMNSDWKKGFISGVAITSALAIFVFFGVY